jgi:hypothetical protein
MAILCSSDLEVEMARQISQAGKRSPSEAKAISTKDIVLLTRFVQATLAMKQQRRLLLPAQGPPPCEFQNLQSHSRIQQ